MNIQPIVEGHGEVAAVPVLLRRLVAEAQAWRVGIGRPIRRPRNQLVQQPGLDTAVNLALHHGCDAILIMFDGDDDCPAELGHMAGCPWLGHRGSGGCAVRSRPAAPGVRIVVLGFNRIASRSSGRQSRRPASSRPRSATRRQGELGSKDELRNKLPGENGPASVERTVLHGRCPYSIPVLPQADEIFRRPVGRNGAERRPMAAGRLDGKPLRWISDTESTHTSVSPKHALPFARVVVTKEQLRDTTWPATPPSSLSIIPFHCFVTGRS